LNWIAAFLTNRKQAVKFDGVLSDWKSVKGGVPQGTKLGVILFIVMTNKLLWVWNLLAKFVDDTSVLEIIPRNSISVLNNAAADIHMCNLQTKIHIVYAKTYYRSMQCRRKLFFIEGWERGPKARGNF
jgi:hypothetical protein